MNCFSLAVVVLSILVLGVSSFSTPPRNAPIQGIVAGSSAQSSILLSKSRMAPHDEKFNFGETKKSNVVANSVLMVMTALLLSTTPVNADEYGRETEAPTLFTGETEMICTKRGPLGACLKTVYRTPENDNDKADNYFQTPTQMVKRTGEEGRAAEAKEANALIDRLKKQTEDNREKNEMLVQQKTFMNDKSASFGPFDRQILILNQDGKGFTLLEKPQAMRLKEKGLIKNDSFVRQPTAEELEATLATPEGPNILERIFGGE